MIIGYIAKFSDKIDLPLMLEALRIEQIASDNGAPNVKFFVNCQILMSIENPKPTMVEGTYKMRTTHPVLDENLVTEQPIERALVAPSIHTGRFIIRENGIVMISVKGIKYKELLCKIRDMYNRKLAVTGRKPIQIGIDYNMNEKMLRELFYSKMVKIVRYISLNRIGEIPPNPIPGYSKNSPIVKLVEDMGARVDKIVVYGKKRIGMAKAKLISRAIVSYSGVTSIEVRLYDKRTVRVANGGFFKIKKERKEDESIMSLGEIYELLRPEITANSDFRPFNVEYEF